MNPTFYSLWNHTQLSNAGMLPNCMTQCQDITAVCFTYNTERVRKVECLEWFEVRRDIDQDVALNDLHDAIVKH